MAAQELHVNGMGSCKLSRRLWDGKPLQHITLTALHVVQDLMSSLALSLSPVARRGLSWTVYSSGCGCMAWLLRACVRAWGARLDVVGAQLAQLGVQAEVGRARLHHALHLCLAPGAEPWRIPVVLQALLRARVPGLHVRAELRPSTGGPPSATSHSRLARRMRLFSRPFPGSQPGCS